MRSVSSTSTLCHTLEPGRPINPDLLAGWRACLDAEASAAVECYPEMIELKLRGEQAGPGKPPIVVTARPSEGHEPGSAAILVGKHWRSGLIPGLPFRISLNGHRVVGDQILGNSDPAHLAAIVSVLEELLRTGQTEAILWEDLDEDSPLVPLFARPGRVSKLLRLSSPQPHWWIRFHENPEDYWKQFSGKTRNTLRRKCKKFPNRLECYTQTDQVSEFLALAHRVSKATWQSQRLGLRIRNSDSERMHWGRVASLGAFRSYILMADSGPIAFLLGAYAGDRFYLEEMGFDATAPVNSPGIVLLIQVLQDLIERETPRCFDFGGGDADYKRLFGNHQTMSGPGLVVANKLRYRVPLLTRRASRELGDLGRHYLRDSKVYSWIRSHVRRVPGALSPVP